MRSILRNHRYARNLCKRTLRGRLDFVASSRTALLPCIFSKREISFVTRDDNGDTFEEFQESERMLVDFSDPDVTAAKILGSDQDIGGESTCTLEYESLPDGSSYSVFSGNLSVEHTGRAVRTGYCAMRTPKPKQKLNLEPFKGLQLKVRTDYRKYQLTMTTDTWINDDVHLGLIAGEKLHPNEWNIMEIDFSNFVLLGKGKYKLFQRPPDPRTIMTLGISCQEDQPGPFRFEIEYIKAVKDVADETERYRRKLLRYGDGTTNDRLIDKIRNKLK